MLKIEKGEGQVSVNDRWAGQQTGRDREMTTTSKTNGRQCFNIYYYCSFNCQLVQMANLK